MDALVTLHSSLATAPSPDSTVEAPAGLKSDLMPHQKEALAWMLHRERQNPAGGILGKKLRIRFRRTTIDRAPGGSHTTLRVATGIKNDVCGIYPVTGKASYDKISCV